ncbi:helix-turn-helix domain-containing protein [Sodalis sp. RH21]|uniref:helix-turn-helix domain-containing protein n=1 Tax=unclassified Sodalis (in: enterobacteria) TaxID=2636512 RepID=UPI0039B41FDA
MSSQPNQSLIDGIRCLQYLVASGRAIGCRELARDLDMNASRVNRLLMTMSSIGLTRQDEKRRYLPGSGIHALAAQAMRGSSLFRKSLDILTEHAPHDHVVALGVLWENKVVYLYHAKPGQHDYQALVDYQIQPAVFSVLGLALLADFTDSHLAEILEPDELASVAHLIAQCREQGSLVWRRDNGEYSLAVKIQAADRTALAFSGLFNLNERQMEEKRAELLALARLLA